MKSRTAITATTYFFLGASALAALRLPYELIPTAYAAPAFVADGGTSIPAAITLEQNDPSADEQAPTLGQASETVSAAFE